MKKKIENIASTFSLDDASIDIIDIQTDSTVKAGLQSSERIERQI